MIKDFFATFVLFLFSFAIVAIPVGYNLYTSPTEQDLYCETVGADPGAECDAAWEARDTR